MAGEFVHGANDRFRSIAQSATVINIDNVTDYFYEQKGTLADHRESWSIDDFPNIAPSITRAWFDFRVRCFPGLRIDAGVLVTTETIEKGEEICPPGVPPILFPNGGWRVSAQVVESTGNDIGAVGVWDYAVHKDGSVWRTAHNAPFTIAIASEWFARSLDDTGSRQAESALRNRGRLLLYPTLLATSFMHCKNVESVEVDQPPKLSRKWEKKNRLPLVRYRVLDIDPMRKVLASEGESGSNGLKKALHICRGHFATYTKEAPLFGRITGTFWKPQHVRGSASSGVVVKDYNVKSPRD